MLSLQTQERYVPIELASSWLPRIGRHEIGTMIPCRTTLASSSVKWYLAFQGHFLTMRAYWAFYTLVAE
jgi:hypothetical protein